tara:strand:+ start:10349 stop:11449 length:1101 start_codon:yes stop_codon:yes gene_type:complete
MKVIEITSSFPEAKAGGVATYVNGRAVYLSKVADVKVLGLGDKDMPCKRVKNDGSGVEEIKVGEVHNFGKSFLKVWAKLIRYIFKNPAQKIEIHNIPVGFPVFLMFPFKATYFFHGPAHLEAKIEGKHRLHQYFNFILESLCLFFSKDIVCVSPAFIDLVKKEHRIICFFKKIKLRLPKLVFQVTENNVIETLDPQYMVFVCVRRLVRRTGVVKLLEAILMLKEKSIWTEKHKLLIVGTGPLENEITTFIDANNLGNTVKLLGRVDDTKRTEIFKSATANVVPTIGLEGFGLVVLEAAFEGCPSIVTDIGGLTFVIDKLNGMGRVCNSSVSGIAEGLLDTDFLLGIDREELKKTSRLKFSVVSQKI